MLFSFDTEPRVDLSLTLLPWSSNEPPPGASPTHLHATASATAATVLRSAEALPEPPVPELVVFGVGIELLRWVLNGGRDPDDEGAAELGADEDEEWAVDATGPPPPGPDDADGLLSRSRLLHFGLVDD